MVGFAVLVLLLTLFDATFGDICPEGSYVRAIDTIVDKDKKAVTAVTLSCAKLETQVISNDFEVTESLTIPKETTGKSTGLEICYRGLARGIIKRYTTSPQAFSDVVLIYANATGVDYQTKSKGVDSGNWQSSETCPDKQALCGLTTTTAPVGGVQTLTDITKLCCSLPEPAVSCHPTDDWMTVLDTDNRKATDTLKRPFSLKIGIQVVGVKSDSVLDEIASQIGFKADDNVIRYLAFKFETTPSASDNTKHFWSRTDQTVFQRGTSTSSGLDLTAPSEFDVVLQQAVGKCGPYVIWTDTIKRVDSGGCLPSCAFTISQLMAIVLVLSSIF